MNRLVRIQQNCRRHAILFAGIALSFYFSYHLIFGARSYDHLQELHQILAQKETDHQEILAQRESLEHDVKMLRPETLSLDLLEERARYVLGYKQPEEFAVFGN